MPTPVELRAKRKNLVEQAHAIVTKAEDEKRELTAEDRQNYDRVWDEQTKLKAEYETLEGDQDRRRRASAALTELAETRSNPLVPERPGTGPAYLPDPTRQPAAYQLALSKGRFRDAPLTLQFPVGSTAWKRHQPEHTQAMRNYLSSGRVTNDALTWAGPDGIRADLSTDTATAGGYMVMPEQFVAELLMNVDDARKIRQLSRTFTTQAQTLGVVKRTAKMASAAWGSEIVAPTKDTTLAYGKRSLTPHYKAGELVVSRDLLRSALLPIESYIRYEIGRDTGELDENAFLTGTGAQQPLGVFTADNNGISTGQDVSTGNTTTSIGADNLRECKYKLKVQYRSHQSLAWFMHRTSVKIISELKDGVGRYLWEPGIELGDPDRILGIRLEESEFAPSTYTTGLYVGILGAWNWYWIVDSLEMDMMVLVEKYAETNQVAYVWRAKTDAMPVIEEAFVRMKLA